MRRRDFLALTCAGGAGVLTSGCAPPSPDNLTLNKPVVGSFDLGEIGIIDTHVHPPRPITLSESYNEWNSSFVNSMLPAYEYEGKMLLRQRLSRIFKEHLYDLPRQTGYYNYMSRVYGVTPDLEGFDQVVSDGIESGFSDYIKSILDRENIVSMVLESRNSAPEPPATPIPSDRFMWSYNIVRLLQPEWAKEQGIDSLQDVLNGIDNVLETCVAKGCVGFKSSIAYYRPLGVNQVAESVANESMQHLLANPPDQYVPFSDVADYQDASLKESFRKYQDYLLRHIFIKAGELKVPVIIHTAVALHPALRFDYNDPTKLRTVFLDDEIKRVETKFLLIHTGYPKHDHVAAMLSQFPNVFTDLSFYSKFPGVLEKTLRTFLALAPPGKVMHGSDSNNVPEEIGYCAWNTRQVLAKILRDYKVNYGWSQANCEDIARKVLHENASNLFEKQA